jgi:transcriptional regulator with XRE-family HTH domain
MKRNTLLQNRLKNISKEAKDFVNLSFEIVDRIHEILESQGKNQKELAISLGKSEAEISKWMRGTHNFTLDTICKIETALGCKILTTYKEETENISFSPAHFVSINVSTQKEEKIPGTKVVEYGYSFLQETPLNRLNSLN